MRKDVYVITLNPNHKLGYNEIKDLYNLIPRRCKSVDFMHGILQGLCFGHQIVYTIEEFERKINNNAQISVQGIAFIEIDTNED